MRRYLLIMVAIALIVSLAGFKVVSPRVYDVPYPEGYRKWTHIKTGIVGPKNRSFLAAGGYHHIYANDKGMIGYETGVFPEGSILIFDVLEATDVNSNVVEGKRRHLDVMMKDSVKFKETGGWGFEEFKEDSKTERTLSAKDKSDCSSCHMRQETMVWSKWRN